jgi:hypothetical protein
MIEEHPGLAGPRQILGRMGGPLEAPYGKPMIEEHPGLAGVRRALGGMGGPLEAPHSRGEKVA